MCSSDLKGDRQSKRSKTRVLNKNGEAPQCSCTIEEFTNMESSLPQNHMEHTTSAWVHRTKNKSLHLHQRYGCAIRRYQFKEKFNQDRPNQDTKKIFQKEYVHKLKDTNWKLKPIENAKS